MNQKVKWCDRDKDDTYRYLSDCPIHGLVSLGKDYGN